MKQQLLRLAARFAAQTLTGLGTGALLELATWKAALMGLAANVIPAVIYLLEQYAAGRTINAIITEQVEQP